MSIIDGMKKLYVVVFLLLAGVIFTAVWFSPLASLGEPYEYCDNAPVGKIEGVCYAPDALVRVDIAGGETALFDALDSIDAEVVKTVETAGRLIAYAYSHRVCARAEVLSGGELYNVMAATDGVTVSIGAPVLSGCY